MALQGMGCSSLLLTLCSLIECSLAGLDWESVPHHGGGREGVKDRKAVTPRVSHWTLVGKERMAQLGTRFFPPGLSHQASP